MASRDAPEVKMIGEEDFHFTANGFRLLQGIERLDVHWWTLRRLEAVHPAPQFEMDLGHDGTYRFVVGVHGDASAVEAAVCRFFAAALERRPEVVEPGWTSITPVAWEPAPFPEVGLPSRTPSGATPYRTATQASREPVLARRGSTTPSERFVRWLLSDARAEGATMVDESLVTTAHLYARHRALGTARLPLRALRIYEPLPPRSHLFVFGRSTGVVLPARKECHVTAVLRYVHAQNASGQPADEYGPPAPLDEVAFRDEFTFELQLDAGMIRVDDETFRLGSDLPLSFSVSGRLDDVVAVRAVDPAPRFLLALQAEGKIVRVLCRPSSQAAPNTLLPEVETLFSAVASAAPAEIRRGWLDAPKLDWEPVASMPIVPIYRRANAIEGLLDWAASTPERPWRRAVRAVAIHDGWVYTERRDGATLRLPLSALRAQRLSARGDTIYTFGRDAELLLPERPDCPVASVLDAQTASRSG